MGYYTLSHWYSGINMWYIIFNFQVVLFNRLSYSWKDMMMKISPQFYFFSLLFFVLQVLIRLLIFITTLSSCIIFV
jgi:hypothetical protein